ncbi:glycoside hydrolase family 97 N-terminal domain-containing protein [Sphingobacterium sp. E70]|uniref:glycoside hydrolase family 97 N-terminal domain-containing protein n=1 Tax=Sphingobacterium sp. E70 TaxID=2853439 RepID=UPI00211C300A|nr:glycoside hydrolase family 97 N-terminal domain-containing protein [Sphingobacterium sp. E70]
MHKGFMLLDTPRTTSKRDSWTPVVKNKHAHVDLQWNETHLALIEKGGEKRRLDLFFRAYDNGIAFRYQLFSGARIGNRVISREMTGFSVSNQAQAWAAQYKPRFTSSQESEFDKVPLTGISDQSLIGLPLLIEVDKATYLAITEANIDNYPGFYISRAADHTTEQVLLTTKLSPYLAKKKMGPKLVSPTKSKPLGAWS